MVQYEVDGPVLLVTLDSRIFRVVSLLQPIWTIGPAGQPGAFYGGELLVAVTSDSAGGSNLRWPDLVAAVLSAGGSIEDLDEHVLRLHVYTVRIFQRVFRKSCQPKLFVNMSAELARNGRVWTALRPALLELGILLEVSEKLGDPRRRFDEETMSSLAFYFGRILVSDDRHGMSPTPVGAAFLRHFEKAKFDHEGFWQYFPDGQPANPTAIDEIASKVASLLESLPPVSTDDIRIVIEGVRDCVCLMAVECVMSRSRFSGVLAGHVAVQGSADSLLKPLKQKLGNVIELFPGHDPRGIVLCEEQVRTRGLLIAASRKTDGALLKCARELGPDTWRTVGRVGLELLRESTSTCRETRRLFLARLGAAVPTNVGAAEFVLNYLTNVADRYDWLNECCTKWYYESRYGPAARLLARKIAEFDNDHTPLQTRVKMHLDRAKIQYHLGDHAEARKALQAGRTLAQQARAPSGPLWWELHYLLALADYAESRILYRECDYEQAYARVVTSSRTCAELRERIDEAADRSRAPFPSLSALQLPSKDTAASRLAACGATLSLREATLFLRFSRVGYVRDRNLLGDVRAGCRHGNGKRARSQSAYADLYEGRACSIVGDLVAAESYAQRALRQFQELNYARGIVQAMRHIAGIRLRRLTPGLADDQLVDIAVTLNEATHLAEQHDLHHEAGNVLVQHANFYSAQAAMLIEQGLETSPVLRRRALDRLTDAERHLDRAEALFRVHAPGDKLADSEVRRERILSRALRARIEKDPVALDACRAEHEALERKWFEIEARQHWLQQAGPNSAVSELFELRDARTLQWWLSWFVGLDLV